MARSAQELTGGAWGLGRGLGEDRWRRSRTRTMRWPSRRRRRVRRREGLRGSIQRCSGSRGPRRSCRTCRGDERTTVAMATAIDGDGGARASRTEARKGTRGGLWRARVSEEGEGACWVGRRAEPVALPLSSPAPPVRWSGGSALGRSVVTAVKGGTAPRRCPAGWACWAKAQWGRGASVLFYFFVLYFLFYFFLVSVFFYLINSL